MGKSAEENEENDASGRGCTVQTTRTRTQYHEKGFILPWLLSQMHDPDVECKRLHQAIGHTVVDAYHCLLDELDALETIYRHEVQQTDACRDDFEAQLASCVQLFHSSCGLLEEHVITLQQQVSGGESSSGVAGAVYTTTNGQPHRPTVEKGKSPVVRGGNLPPPKATHRDRACAGECVQRMREARLRECCEQRQRVEAIMFSCPEPANVLRFDRLHHEGIELVVAVRRLLEHEVEVLQADAEWLQEAIFHETSYRRALELWYKEAMLEEAHRRRELRKTRVTLEHIERMKTLPSSLAKLNKLPRDVPSPVVDVVPPLSSNDCMKFGGNNNICGSTSRAHSICNNTGINVVQSPQKDATLLATPVHPKQPHRINKDREQVASPTLAFEDAVDVSSISSGGHYYKPIPPVAQSNVRRRRTQLPG